MARNSVISIDIGFSKTKIAVGSIENNKIHIEKAFMIDTPKGSFEDGRLLAASGAEAFGKALARALLDNRIRSRETVITIQSTMIIRRELEVPKVKPKEMESMIQYEIEQYLPIDLNEYVIEYKTLEEKLDNKNKVRILVAAIPKSIAEDYYNIFNSVNLEPKALDVNSNSVSKLFGQKLQINGCNYELDSTVALIDIGFQSIGVTIVSKGFFQFSRLIPTGWIEIDGAIAELYGMYEPALEEKRMQGVDINLSPAEIANNPQSAAAAQILNRWTEDIQRVFQYYKTRNANNSIDKIYLYGGASNITGIEAYFTSTTGVPSERIKSLDCVLPEMTLSGAGIENYINCIGAIIRK